MVDGEMHAHCAPRPIGPGMKSVRISKSRKDRMCDGGVSGYARRIDVSESSLAKNDVERFCLGDLVKAEMLFSESVLRWQKIFAKLREFSFRHDDPRAVLKRVIALSELTARHSVRRDIFLHAGSTGDEKLRFVSAGDENPRAAGGDFGGGVRSEEFVETMASH